MEEEIKKDLNVEQDISDIDDKPECPECKSKNVQVTGHCFICYNCGFSLCSM